MPSKLGLRMARVRARLQVWRVLWGMVEKAEMSKFYMFE